jgi:hypothetical protein
LFKWQQEISKTLNPVKSSYLSPIIRISNCTKRAEKLKAGFFLGYGLAEAPPSDCMYF